MEEQSVIKNRWKNRKWLIWSTIVSLAVSVLLVTADYAIQNISFPLFDDVKLMAYVDYKLGDRIEKKKNYFNEDSVTYVNFGKDKALVPVIDIFGTNIGKEVITDRDILLRFLDLASKSNYKYIFLDLRFQKGHETPLDSALFHRIKSMPNLIIATHRGGDGYVIADSSLLAKAAYADYRGSLFSGFTRYEFLQDGHRSVALQMLYDIDKQDIKKTRLGYSSNGKLCYNLKYIPFPRFLYKGKTTDVFGNAIGEEVRYPYAGSMILNPQFFLEEEVIHNLLDNKIVIVGDFDNDLHSTYIGEIPGPVLSFAAYEYLHDGQHIVRWSYMLFLFSLYFLVSFFIIISGGHIANFFENWPIFHFLLSFVGLSILFLFIKIILYGCFLISMVMIVPSLVFGMMSTISYAVYTYQNKKKTSQ